MKSTFPRAACALLALLALSGCGRSEAAGKIWFQDIETRPMTRDQLVSDYKAMAAERCDKGLIVAKLSPAECHAHVQRAQPACDAEAASRMPAEVASRDTAIDFAKGYTRCVLP
jgi:hypothetical protein